MLPHFPMDCAWVRNNMAYWHMAKFGAVAKVSAKRKLWLLILTGLTCVMPLQ